MFFLLGYIQIPMNLQTRIQEEFDKRSYRVLVPIAGISVLLTPTWILMDYFATPSVWKTLAALRLGASALYLIFFILLKTEKLKWKPVLYLFVLVTAIDTAWMAMYVPSEMLNKFLTGYAIVYIIIAALIYVTWKEYLLMFATAIFFLVLFNWFFQAHPMEKMLFVDGLILLVIGGFGTVAAYMKYNALIREITAQVKNEILTQELQATNEELQQTNEELHKQSEFVKELNLRLEKQNEELFKKNKDITDSIRVAERLQGALLATNKEFFKYFPEHFIFFKPKDIVSGDFYWFYADKEGNKFLAVADCTGHGVPGSILSVLGLNLLNELVKENIKRPDLLLNELRKRINKILNPEGSAQVMYEGMDISLLKFSGTQMEWTGAYNPLYVITRNEETLKKLEKYLNPKTTLQDAHGTLIQIPADKMPVGYSASDAPFTLHSFEVSPGDELILFSDGFPDQFGGKNDKKLKVKNFKRLLLSLSSFPVNIQVQKLEEFFNTWKGSNEQTDDVTVIGINLSL